MNSPAVAQGLTWAAVGLFFFALNKVMLAALNALSRLKEYALYMALRYVFMIGMLLVLIGLGQGGDKVVLVLPVAEGILFCLLFVALFRELAWPGLTPMRQWMGTHLDFGLRGVGGNLMLDLNTRVDVLCLGLFVSERVVGIYSMAAILAEAAYQLPLVLRTVYNPQVIQMLARRAYEPLQILIRQTRLLIWIGMVLAGTVGFFLYPHVIPWISGKPEYAEGAVLFGVIMFGMVYASGYVPFGMLLLNAGHPGCQTGMIVFLLLCNVCGNFLLIPFLGSLGAAMATATTHVFSVVLLRYFSCKFLELRI
jgi:O-antigen/teichoic acid export membrane protein